MSPVPTEQEKGWLGPAGEPTAAAIRKILARAEN
jgi:hypothetical protein